MLRILPALAAMACLLAIPANAEPLTQKHDRNDVKTACDNSKGDYYSNLDGYGCTKSCKSSSGKDALCGVNCDNNSNCQGQTPGLVGGGKRGTLGYFLGAAKRPAGAR